MSKSVDIETIAAAVGKHRTTVLRRAKAEFWFRTSAIGPGGEQHLYPVSTLPQDVHEKVVAHLAAEQLAAIEADDPDSLRAMVEKTIEEDIQLPLDIRIALCQRELQAQKPALPAPATSVPSVTQLTDAQRRTAEARMAILAEIDRLAAASTVKMAIRQLCLAASTGRLAPRIAQLVPTANAKAGADRTLSVPTVMRWRAARKDGGFAALAPKERERDMSAPWFADGFLRHWRAPGKRSAADCLRSFAEELADVGLLPPSYSQIDRFLKSMGTVERNRGRKGPRELKTLKSFVRRDDSQLLPLDVVQMDGHQFDAEVAHPAHGGPFRPEITPCLDTKTRLMMGFSTGLAESAFAVADALRDSIGRFGIPQYLYTDRGSGYEAGSTSDPVVGLLARLEIGHLQSLPYNSQARGRIERSHRTVWVALAKTYPTYIGKPMDAEAKQIVHKLTRRDLAGRGAQLLPTWSQFITDCRRAMAEYNARPHRSLPTIVADGKRRNMSPAEAWVAEIEAGWTPDMLPAEIVDDLFRPHRIATTRRGLVVLQNLEYFHEALVEFGGEQVQVAFEPTNPEHVWVKTLEGRLICKAKLDGNKHGFLPKSIQEQLNDRRANGRLRRLEGHAEEVRAELRGGAIEHDPQVLTMEEIQDADRVIEFLRPAPVPEPISAVSGARPIRFHSDEHKVEWMAANPDLVTPDDIRWFHNLRAEQGPELFENIHGGLVDRILQQQSASKQSAAG